MESNHAEMQPEHNGKLTAESLVKRVEEENYSTLFGDRANAMYMEYLKSGGSIHALDAALVEASNEEAAKVILVDLTNELLEGKFEYDKPLPIDLVKQVKEMNPSLIGEVANARYMEYLKSGGSINSLCEALRRASSTATARKVLCDLVDKLLK